MGTGRYYSKQLKEEVVEKIKTSGKPVSQIASEYGVNVKLANYIRNNGPVVPFVSEEIPLNCRRKRGISLLLP